MKAYLPSHTVVQNRYLIQKLLGQGGFGRTYLALDKQRFNEKCVLKEFIPEQTGDVQKAIELYEREAKTLYELNHLQIPKFGGYFQEDDRLFLVQEYIDGKTYATLLEERQKQGKSFSEEEITKFIRDLLPVLHYIHEKGIIHRDISPDNIMRSNQSSLPILIDFGVVRQQKSLSNAQRTIIAKEGYCTTEQLRGDCFFSTDLYALAVTSIVLLTGRQPKDLWERNSLQYKWRSFTTVSDHLAFILNKMLSDQPEDRYQSAAEVIKALSNQPKPKTQLLKTDLSVLPLNKPIKPKPKIILKGLIFTILGAGIIWMFSVFEPICQLFSTCEIKEYRQGYQEAEKQAREAIRSFQNAQTVTDLENSYKQIKQAINQLNTIPKKASVYRQAQDFLPSYQNQSQEIREHLKQVIEAQKALSEAENLAHQASQLTGQAQTVKQLQAAKYKWELARQQLQRIPSDSLKDLVSKQKILQNEYDKKSQKIDQRIKDCQDILFGVCQP